MIKKTEQSSISLSFLFHHRWAVPTLAALNAFDGGAKFVTLQRSLRTSRDSLKRTLAALIEAGLVSRNPGYGHPMRPEYLLTAWGNRVAPACTTLVEKLEHLGIEEVGLKKWPLPVAHALATAGGRFNRVRVALGEVTPRALAQALRDLQKIGLVRRLLVDDSPPRTEYQLTRRGRLLTPLILALAQAS
jgi:DNA-binding HxlR family transcriptional regulator